MTQSKEKVVELCHYCGRKPGVTIDHIVPRAFGGASANYNYQPSCQDCNGAKSDFWPTCTCEKCTNAVKRFLDDPTKRAYALRKLDKNASNLNEGIRRYHVEIKKLKWLLGNTKALVRTMEDYGEFGVVIGPR